MSIGGEISLRTGGGFAKARGGGAQPPQEIAQRPRMVHHPPRPSVLQTSERGRVVSPFVVAAAAGSNALFSLSSGPRFLQASGKPRDGPSGGRGA